DAAECSRAFVRRLDELRSYAGLPMNLLEAGIPESELERIVEEGLSYRRNVENYAAPLSREDVERMVRDAFGGARS
ncbi:MAG: hypothetical protein QW624_02435, partial [Nitrososphaerota archaeon]